MRRRLWEKLSAIALALLLAAGVMRGVVFAGEGEPEPASDDMPVQTEAMDRAVEANRAEAAAEAAASAADTEAMASVGASAEGVSFVKVELSYAEELTAETAETTDNRASLPLYINGAVCGACTVEGGVPYVGVETFCRGLGLNVSGSGSAGGYVLSGGGLTIEAAEGAIYFCCNGRYYYIENGVRFSGGQAVLPAVSLARCFGLSMAWDRGEWRLEVEGEPTVPVSGEAYYNESDVYWLSHVIFAEAGNQPLLGQLAVGDVVLSRVADSRFEDTVYSVIFAKNQFEVVINGMIYMEPTEQAVVAAKLALEGYNVVPGALYFATFDFGEGYECLTWIGDHCFMAEA